ncbi:MAG: ABC transporter ATP-binding protein [Chloroflexi bacterium]|nr:ABC transporter ATP-binding protein [Chloroflexota bacterium]
MSIQISHLHKLYPSKQGEVQALNDVTFEVKAHEFVSVLGPSGCGKSTLLRIIAGLIEPSSGSIAIDIEGEEDRPQNAMVFQGQGLFPWMTLTENVRFGLKMNGVSDAESSRRVSDILEQFGLEKFQRHFPYELSGGMKQRAALARAFLTNPQVLLMDEPFAALDAQSRLLLQQELLRMWQNYRKTIIFVTHDIEESILLSDRIIVMSGRPGRIVQEIIVPFERPRNLVQPAEPEKVSEIKRGIWAQLESEVKSSLEAEQ